jgi:hypothetical protein
MQRGVKKLIYAPLTDEKKLMEGILQVVRYILNLNFIDS